MQHRVQRGVGNPCPLVLIGLPASMIRFDAAKVDTLEERILVVPLNFQRDDAGIVKPTDMVNFM